MKRLVRVTQLESFRKFITGDEDRENFVVTEQQVIDGITGVFTGNEQTRIGTAFHRIVEGNTEGVEKIGEGFRTFLYYGKEVQEYVPTGRKFNIDGHGVCLDVAQCKVALAYKNQYPDAFHEIREYMDMGDIAAAIAPRKLIVINGQRDSIFPDNGVREAFDTVRKIYKSAGVPENCAMTTGDGGHRYYKANAWGEFDKMVDWD